MPKRSWISARTIFELQITARSTGLSNNRRSILSTYRWYGADSVSQRRSGDNRRRHETVRGLVMLVHRDDVEAELLAVLELIQIAVVELVALLRIEILVRQRHPDRAVLLALGKVEVRVRH